MRVNTMSLLSGCGVFLAAALAPYPASTQNTPDDSVSLATGLIIPAGPPLSVPVRVDAGDSCIVDIVLPYVIAGSLEGAAEINYRIDVKGPCADAVPGRFDESWIARGTLSGMRGDASFVYVADVKAGGKLKGEVVFGQGLNGWLKVSGSLADDHLDYRGFLQFP